MLDIVFYQDSKNLIIKSLLFDVEEGAGRVLIIHKGVNSISVSEITEIVFKVVLICVKLFCNLLNIILIIMLA